MVLVINWNNRGKDGRKGKPKGQLGYRGLFLKTLWSCKPRKHSCQDTHPCKKTDSDLFQTHLVLKSQLFFLQPLNSNTLNTLKTLFSSLLKAYTVCCLSLQQAPVRKHPEQIQKHRGEKKGRRKAGSQAVSQKSLFWQYSMALDQLTQWGSWGLGLFCISFFL